MAFSITKIKKIVNQTPYITPKYNRNNSSTVLKHDYEAFC